MHTVEDNICWRSRATAGRLADTVWRATAEAEDRIDGILRITRLTGVRDRIAGGLSHGQKQWLEIGMLLAQETQAPTGGRAGRRMTMRRRNRPPSCSSRSTAIAPSWWFEHDMAFVRELGVQGHGAARRRPSSRKDRSIRFRRTSGVIEVYLGR